ncbi:MAG: radical SAM family heme chaperone HemW [Opitutaceae bacterium]|jgi:oxygen-independent coproporphyrinogen-3 oxidase|nr:radical SAM family heme chaperone HemW [Opitutaceae bacterium]
MNEINRDAKVFRGGAGVSGGNSAPGLYVHVPFCATRCDFCAFYEERPDAGAVRRYLAGMEREAALLGGPLAVETVFWGGGTPGVLAAADLRRLGGITLSCCAAAPREWSVELAPGSVTGARLAVLRELGVTRISLGAQSFQPALLEALGRRHSPAQIRRAYERIRAAGFASVNLDLMFALPGQDEAAWLADLREAVAMRPEHISTYCLTFEEDTALWVKLSQGGVKLDRGREAALYERTWAELAGAGFAQYEISNFARPGHECIHNLNTWRMGGWLGLGPSAASQHAGWRGANPPDLGAWLAGLARGERAAEGRVALTEALLAEDALIFGLRMNAGVDLAALRGRHPGAGWAAADAFAARLADEGLAEREGDKLRLTLKGRLVADAIGVEAVGLLSGMRQGDV